MMSRSYLERVAYPPKGQAVESPESTEQPKPRRTRGTGEFVQVKLSRHTYDALKVVAGLSGKTAPEMLDRFVSEGVAGFENMTVRELLSK